MCSYMQEAEPEIELNNLAPDAGPRCKVFEAHRLISLTPKKDTIPLFTQLLIVGGGTGKQERQSTGKNACSNIF